MFCCCFGNSDKSIPSPISNNSSGLLTTIANRVKRIFKRPDSEGPIEQPKLNAVQLQVIEEKSETIESKEADKSENSDTVYFTDSSDYYSMESEDVDPIEEKSGSESMEVDEQKTEPSSPKQQLNISLIEGGCGIPVETKTEPMMFSIYLIDRLFNADEIYFEVKSGIYKMNFDSETHLTVSGVSFKKSKSLEMKVTTEKNESSISFIGKSFFKEGWGVKGNLKSVTFDQSLQKIRITAEHNIPFAPKELTLSPQQFVDYFG